MNKRSIFDRALVGGALGWALLWASALMAEPVAVEGPSGPGPGASPMAGVNMPELESALEQLKRGDLPGALRQLDDAAKKNPELPPGKIIISRELLRAGQPAMAIQFLQQAAQESPDAPEAYAYLAELALGQQHWVEARLLYEQALKLVEGLKDCPKRQSSMNSAVHKGLAVAAEARKDWAAMQKHAEAALQAQANDPMALQQLGQALFFLSKPEEALAKFREAAKLDPKARTPEVSMAFLYEQAGNREKAAQAMVEALKAKPRDLQTRLDAVQWSLDTGQLDQAQAQAKSALQIDPTSIPALMTSGLVSLMRKDYAAAEEDFQKAHLQEPDNTTICNNLALALAEQKDEAKRARATKYAQISRRLAPQDAETLSAFGWVAYKRGQLDAAEQALNQAVQTPGIGPDTFYYRARLATDKKDLVTARRLLEVALTLKGTFTKRQEAEQLLKDLK